MSLSALETLVRTLGFVTVGSTAVAAVAGCFLWLFSDKLSARKDAAQAQFQEDSKTAIAETKAEAAKEVARLNALAEASRVEVETLKKGRDADRIELEKQRQETAKAQRELLEVQERLKPRRLRDGQKVLLIDALKRVKGRIDIVAAGGDNETNSFAAEWAGVFRAAGWEVSSGMTALESNPVGLFLWVHSANKLPPRALELAKAFAANGIKLIGENRPEMAEDDVTLLVGVKPQP